MDQQCRDSGTHPFVLDVFHLLSPYVISVLIVKVQAIFNHLTIVPLEKQSLSHMAGERSLSNADNVFSGSLCRRNFLEKLAIQL
jgi:hypothetical protein